jgi:aspartate racemase
LSIGKVDPDMKRMYIEICNRHIRQNKADAVILGCTEIPMILKEGDLEVPLIDTLYIHVKAIFEKAMTD